jgi:hypothetical protein
MGSRARGSGGFWSNAKPGGGRKGIKSGASGTYPSDSSEDGVRRAGWGAWRFISHNLSFLLISINGDDRIRAIFAAVQNERL